MNAQQVRATTLMMFESRPSHPQPSGFDGRMRQAFVFSPLIWTCEVDNVPTDVFFTGGTTRRSRQRATMDVQTLVLRWFHVRGEPCVTLADFIKVFHFKSNATTKLRDMAGLVLNDHLVHVKPVTLVAVCAGGRRTMGTVVALTKQGCIKLLKYLTRSQHAQGSVSVPEVERLALETWFPSAAPLAKQTWKHWCDTGKHLSRRDAHPLYNKSVDYDHYPPDVMEAAASGAREIKKQAHALPSWVVHKDDDAPRAFGVDCGGATKRAAAAVDAEKEVSEDSTSGSDQQSDSLLGERALSRGPCSFVLQLVSEPTFTFCDDADADVPAPEASSACACETKDVSGQQMSEFVLDSVLRGSDVTLLSGVEWNDSIMSGPGSETKSEAAPVPDTHHFALQRWRQKKALRAQQHAALYLPSNPR